MADTLFPIATDDIAVTSDECYRGVGLDPAHRLASADPCGGVLYGRP